MKITVTDTRVRGRRWFDEAKHAFPCPRAPGCLECFYVEKMTIASQRDPHIRPREVVIDVEHIARVLQNG